jgi:RNA polymerase sigma-70 factor (ECF subfamily)
VGGTLSLGFDWFGRGAPADAAPARRVSEGVVEHAVERAVRESYGRLVAILASRTRDVAAAEDALSDAVLAALRQWPDEGVPRNPESWLLAVARRRGLDGARRAAVRDAMEPALEYAAQLAGDDAARRGAAGAMRALPDRRAELLFACADPAIDAEVRTPLMLQVVLGLDASQVASAFLSSPSAMAQRLVRAKRKIRDAGIAFRIPEPEERAERLEAVLEALYGAFGTAWDQIDGSAPGGREARFELRDEVISLAAIVHDAMPDEPEASGLLALLLYCRARDHARRGADGEYVPLSQQATSRWDRASIERAEALLRAASRVGRPGRFQLEAAIQSAHVSVLFGDAASPAVIAGLYDALVSVAPTVGAYVNRAAAHARAFGSSVGLAAAEALPLDAVTNYQPWWALRAHLLHELGRTAEARVARERAAALTEEVAVRGYLGGC